MAPSDFIQVQPLAPDKTSDESREFQMAPDASIIPPSDFIQVQPLAPDKTSDESSLAATARQESEGGGELEDDLKKDSRIVAGLLDVVCILWMTNGRNLAKP